MPESAGVAHAALFDSHACCDAHDNLLPQPVRTEMAREGSDAHGEIGYIVMGFPRISETFISNEIHLLESLGARLRVFAVKNGGEQQVHDSVGLIRAPITYLPPMTSLSGTSLLAWLRCNWRSYRAQHLSLLRAYPLRYVTTLASAIAMSWRYRKSAFSPRKVFIKEFLQAGHIATQVLAAGTVRHLHGHFCHGATTITWFASRLTGLGFSFTAHAKDIYQVDQNPGDLLQRKLQAARFATTCTGANEQHLAQRFPADCKKVHTIYHGLDTKFFAPGAISVAAVQQAPLILAVGRFVEKKGFAYLIDACAKLRAQGAAFRCLILGEKGDQLEVVQQQIVRLGLAQHITLRGSVTHAELRAIYAQAAAFVLPCLVAADGDRDGIPNVLAEAMAMGLPVVTTDVSGIPELVDSEEDGLIVPERDADALAVALTRLLHDAALRQRLGAAARGKICRVFNSRQTTLALKALFDDAVAQVERK